MEAEGDVLGYGAGGDDGNGVVGGAKIGYAHQCGYAQFRSPLAGDVAGMPVPMAPNQSKNPIPVKRPMIPVEKMPSSSTDITFIPAIAVPSTMR